MKRAVVGVAVLVLVAGVVLRAQAPKPYPELKKLQPFIGEWVSEGEDKATPLGPAGKTTGKATGKWMLNGFHLEWEYAYTNEANQKFSGREIDCYDPISKTFPARWFENDGSYTSGAYIPNGNVIVFQGTTTNATRKYEFRQTYTYAPDFNSYTYKAEISLDGKVWILGNEGKGTRVKSSQK
jgi:hypothetical protein